MELENIVETLKANELYFMLIKEPSNYIKAVTGLDGFTYKDEIIINENNEHITVRIFPLHYEDGQDDIESIKNGLGQLRFSCVKEIYYRWCDLKGLKPNPNEGWFKSKKFSKYIHELNYTNMNYAILGY